MGIENVKQQYNAKEWESREEYYIKHCSRIKIPKQPDGKSIMNLTAQIDDILSEALLEQAYIKKTLANLKNKLMLAEKETHLVIKVNNFKENGINGIPSNKVTADDVKSSVVTFLKNNKLENMPLDIYSMVLKAENRCTFIDSVVRILAEKKSALIADNAILKLEGSIRN